jgi:hypothetical protein
MWENGQQKAAPMSTPTSPRLYFMGYELRPAPGADAAGIGGAFVRVWLKAPSLEDARRRAQEHLVASGWTILSTLKEAEIRSDARSDAGSEEDRGYLRQAQAEGEVFVIDAFPDEPAEA